MKNKIINILKYSVLIVCLLLFIIICIKVYNRDIMSIDIEGYKLIKRYLIRDSITPIMKIITWFGSASGLIFISILLLIFIKNKRISLYIIINLILIKILNIIFKYVFMRPRPIGYRIVEERGYSFPSGHSMVSMAFYGFIIYLIYKYIKNKYLKYSMIIIISILIMFIGISRIYLGVHYTSDILGGFLVSIVYLFIYINCIKMKLANRWF